MTVVLEGRRRFVTRDGVVEAMAGETVVIPAHLPHRAVRLDLSRSACLNYYLPDDVAGSALPALAVIPTPAPLATRAAGLDLGTAAATLERCAASQAAGGGPARDLIDAVLGSPRRIGEIAGQLGMSREAFIRRFARETGMTPHAYRIADRLNRARRLLRLGAAPAAAAADAGFADQSHLGRRFRAAFGTTPSTYRRSVSG